MASKGATSWNRTLNLILAGYAEVTDNLGCSVVGVDRVEEGVPDILVYKDASHDEHCLVVYIIVSPPTAHYNGYPGMGLGTSFSY